MPRSSTTLSPATVADAFRVAMKGGNLAELAEACRVRAPAYRGEQRARLLQAAASLEFVAEMLREMARLEAVEDAGP